MDAKQDAKGSVDAKKVPAGDACKECFTVWMTAFSTMEWEEFCSWSATAEGAGPVAEAAATLSGQPKDFFAESVSEDSQIGMRLERPFIVMNRLEYKSFMGKEPTSRDPKVPTLTVPTADGKSETVWAFKDPAQPFRKLILYNDMVTNRMQQIMTEDAHLYAKQGEVMSGFTANARQVKSGLANLFTVTVPCMHDVRDKIGIIKSEVLDNRTTGTASAVHATDPAEAASKQVHGPRGAGEVESSDEEPSLRTRVVPTLLSKLGNMHEQTSAGRKRRKPSAALATALSKPDLSGAKGSQWGRSQCGRTAAADDDSDSDGASIATCAASGQKWIIKLDMDKLLSGSSNLGREIRFATDAMNKAGDVERLLIKKHLKLVWASEAFLFVVLYCWCSCVQCWATAKGCTDA